MRLFIYLFITFYVALTFVYTCQAQDPGNLVHQPKVSSNAIEDSTSPDKLVIEATDTVTINVTEYQSLKQTIQQQQQVINKQNVVIAQQKLKLAQVNVLIKSIIYYININQLSAEQKLQSIIQLIKGENK